jgi:predicted transposase/invertase (TIGR01784 family)
MVREVQLLNPFTEQDFAFEKVSILDIRARDQAGRQFNLEMQRVVPWSFSMRVAYYLAQLHGQQLYTGDYYETICPTHAICFLEGRLIDDNEYYHAFVLHDPERGKTFSKDLQVHVLELDKFAVKLEQLQTPLQQWCCFLRYGQNLDSERLPATLDVPVIRQALEVLMALSRDERERHRIQDRMRGIADANNFRQEALHAQERAEKGEPIGRIHAFQEMLQQPTTPTSELEELTLGQLMQFAEQLKQQLAARNNGGSKAPEAT